MNGWLLAALALSALTAFAFGAFALYHRAFDRQVRRMGYLTDAELLRRMKRHTRPLMSTKTTNTPETRRRRP